VRRKVIRKGVCARYFVAALFKELTLITIREMWGLESRSWSWSRTSRPRSRSRLLWQSLGLVSKFEPGLGLGLGGYGLDYITTYYTHYTILFLFVNHVIFETFPTFPISYPFVIWQRLFVPPTAANILNITCKTSWYFNSITGGLSYTF